MEQNIVLRAVGILVLIYQHKLVALLVVAQQKGVDSKRFPNPKDHIVVIIATRTLFFLLVQRIQRYSSPQAVHALLLLLDAGFAYRTFSPPGGIDLVQKIRVFG